LDEWLRLFLLFAVGAIAGFINVNAGGGSSLTLPALILLGLESSVANGTNRIGIAVQTMFAVSSFRRRNFHDFKTSGFMALFTLPGAVLGAFLSIRIGDQWFQRILGIVMIGIVFSIIFSSYKKDHAERPVKNWLIYPVMLGIGFYGGFIQIGVGFIFMASLYHILHISLIHVNMHKVFIIFIYTLPALAVFIISGRIAWIPGLIMAAGMAAGGWWGAHAVVKGGERTIRIVLVVAILIMALKMLGLF